MSADLRAVFPGLQDSFYRNLTLEELANVKGGAGRWWVGLLKPLGRRGVCACCVRARVRVFEFSLDH